MQERFEKPGSSRAGFDLIILILKDCNKVINAAMPLSIIVVKETHSVKSIQIFFFSTIGIKVAYVFY